MILRHTLGGLRLRSTTNRWSMTGVQPFQPFEFRVPAPVSGSRSGWQLSELPIGRPGGGTATRHWA